MRGYSSLVAGITHKVQNTMYIERFWVKNWLGDTVFDVNFCDPDHRICRWSLFQNVGGENTDREKTLFFKFLAVCLGGSPYLKRLRKEISRVYGRTNEISSFGAMLRSDTHKTKKKEYFYRAKSEFVIPPGGIIELASKEKFRWQGYYTSFTGFNDLRKTIGDFAYGFNAGRTGYSYQEEDPDFPPRIRSSRFGTFFDEAFSLTPAAAWLNKQYQAAIRNSLKGASLYNTVLTAFSSLLFDVKFSCCDNHTIIFVKKKSGPTRIDKKSFQNIFHSDLPRKKINLIDFLIDFIRHMVDSRRLPNEFNLCQGILFIDHFEELFSTRQTPEAMKALENLFPNIQFIIGCHTKNGVAQLAKFQNKPLPVVTPRNHVKQYITAKSTSDRKTWDYRNNFLKSRFGRTPPAGKDDVVLIDVDSMIPNLSLMKLSRYYKNQGRKVILTRGYRIHRKSKFIFASCVFKRPSTAMKIKKMTSMHGENIKIGGTGFDLSLTLPNEIESSMPDYSLYPNVDFAMGFITRGCPKNCGFCIVPAKEGRLRQVAEIDDILPPEFNKLVLMDNNLLAHPKADKILEEMIEKKVQVNFNQTLDIRLINKRNANLLQKIDSKNYSFTKRMYYFSFNTSDMIPVIRKKLKLLDSLKRTEIRFICMYGYNTTLSEDIERFSFLHKIGTSPFVQRYQPVLEKHPPKIKNYFDTKIDPLLQVHFEQNGRIFENFLKWVSKKYVEQFGKLHMPLVDLIFKYNNKHSRHLYIESLAGTKKLPNPGR